MDTAANATTHGGVQGLLQQSMQNWPASISLLLLGTVLLVLLQAAQRPSFPKSAPVLLRAESWPVLGALRFFSDRTNFFQQSVAKSKSGNFSFYFGKHRIVGMSGLEGRKTFYQSKELNMPQGVAVLYTTTPPTRDNREKSVDEILVESSWFNRTLIRMMKKENFGKNLAVLVGDTHARLKEMVARTATSGAGAGAKGIFLPSDDIYRIVYQLTMRTVGATEIAESPELMARSLAMFETIERSSSPARIIFPWLLTPNHLRRMAAGTRLFFMFSKIVGERRDKGVRFDDALQFLIDSGESTEKMMTFVLGALFAGQVNSGVNAACLLIYLGINTEWYALVRAEVDGVVARRRISASQSAVDVLTSLTADEWESEFPLIDTALRECIRLHVSGSFFRKNISGHEVAIGSTGEVIPADAFAAFHIDDIHYNPAIYRDPQVWDPSRYLPDRAEDKAEPLAYAGWGSGRHPCLGMKFAKLEMAIIAAVFVAMFDFETIDDAGNKVLRNPVLDRSEFSVAKIPDLRIRWTLRQS